MHTIANTGLHGLHLTCQQTAQRLGEYVWSIVHLILVDKAEDPFTVCIAVKYSDCNDDVVATKVAGVNAPLEVNVTAPSPSLLSTCLGNRSFRRGD